MAEIFKKHAEISGYELPENWKEPITAYFSTRVNDENFGNGREARALFEKVSVQMAKRIMGDANGGLQNSINEKAINNAGSATLKARSGGQGKKTNRSQAV